MVGRWAQKQDGLERVELEELERKITSSGARGYLMAPGFEYDICFEKLIRFTFHIQLYTVLGVGLV